MVTPRVQVKELRRTYGFDEVAIVPGDVTTNPEHVVTELTIGPYRFSIPVLASAMDAVVDPAFAGHMTRAGGLAVLNLEGVQCRYERPAEVLERVTSTPQKDVTALLQELYAVPIREDLVGRRVSEIKEAGAVCAVSMIPASTKRLAPPAVEAGGELTLHGVFR